jgi:hypothetical protein
MFKPILEENHPTIDFYVLSISVFASNDSSVLRIPRPS